MEKELKKEKQLENLRSKELKKEKELEKEIEKQRAEELEKEKELIKMHKQVLKKQLDAAGFPSAVIDDLLEEFEPFGQRVYLRFETRINRTLVRGFIDVERNEADGFYTIDYFRLTLSKAVFSKPGADQKPLVEPVLENKFLWTPYSWIRLDEAVNLMLGRYAYRKPELDPTGEGYWMYLTKEELFEGFRQLGILRIKFDVGNFLAETGLGAWVGLTGWVQLVDDLERGCRCDLVIGAGADMTTVRIEADPRGQRLVPFDLRGKELKLEKLMKRKYHGNVE